VRPAQTVKTFSIPKKDHNVFHRVSVSPRGKWLECVAEDANIYSFSVETGSAEGVLPVHEKDITGIVQHPHRGLFATFSPDGTVRLWRA